MKSTYQYITIGILLLGICGCAGSGTIKEYDVVNGKKTLKSITEFEGRNIKVRTEKGAEMETKNLEFPTVPFKF